MGPILGSQHGANRPRPNRSVDVKILQVNFLRNQPFIAIILVLSFFSFPACSSRSGPPDTRYVPAGDLLDIVKDFQRLAKEDTYRFPIPKDVTGVNIMKATLVRLNDYERKNPGQFSDIVQFNKALALERLREYDQAAALYRKVAETDGRLASEAAKNAELLDNFLRIFDKVIPADDPFKYIAGLDEKVAAWNQLMQKYQGTQYAFLAESKRSALTAPRSPLSKPTAIVSRKAIS